MTEPNDCSNGNAGNKTSQTGARRWPWLLSLLVLAPLELGAKGCDSAVVGNDCPSGSVDPKCTATGGRTSGSGGNASAGSGSSSGGASNAGVCGGLLGTQCASGQYCDFPIDAQCGAADQTGKCVPLIDGACTTDYVPVCGCDGKTYGNACAAGLAGVSVAALGECEPVGVDCGGLLGVACGRGEYCNYPISAQCGAADQTGKCAALPEVCNDVYAPVCGCDGKTYSNACEAGALGVSPASEGACGTDPSPVGTCGGDRGLSCAKGEYCKYAPDDQCGAADQTGVCAALPTGGCREIYLPVCGCDGKTYGNECEAATAGVSTAYEGECKTAGSTACGGLLGLSCAKGEYCSYEVDALCGAADQTGVCAAIPDACDLVYQPVCGCDGMTYGNACAAAMAGVAVSAEAACEAPQGTVCGGLRGATCAKGEFCNFAVEAKCGLADQTGLCEVTPVGCTKQLEEVCGCDGKDYGNPCMAHAAGTSVASTGRCQ